MSDNSAGSFWAASQEAASCAFPHSVASTAPLTITDASAISIRRRCKSFSSVSPEIIRLIYDTTVPTKEGLLRDDKIVSNLHEQVERPRLSHVFEKCQIRSAYAALGIHRTCLYGASVFPCGAALPQSCANTIAIQGEFDVRSRRPALPQRCWRSRHRDRLAGIHVRGRQSAVRSPARLPGSWQRQRDHLPLLLDFVPPLR